MSEYLNNLITKIVDDKPGIKGTELVVEVIVKMHESSNDKLPDDEGSHSVISAINAMVETKHLVEIEYVMPTTSYRVKSMYFPKGTHVKIVK